MANQMVMVVGTESGVHPADVRCDSNKREFRLPVPSWMDQKCPGCSDYPWHSDHAQQNLPPWRMKVPIQATGISTRTTAISLGAVITPMQKKNEGGTCTSLAGDETMICTKFVWELVKSSKFLPVLPVPIRTILAKPMEAIKHSD